MHTELNMRMLRILIQLFFFQRSCDVATSILKFIQPQIVGIGELYNMDSLHIVCEGSIVVNLPQLRIIDAAVVLLATFYLYKIDYKEAKAILCFLVRIS